MRRSKFPFVPVALGAAALAGVYYAVRRSQAQAQIDRVRASTDPRVLAALGVVAGMSAPLSRVRAILPAGLPPVVVTPVLANIPWTGGMTPRLAETFFNQLRLASTRGDQAAVQRLQALFLQGGFPAARVGDLIRAARLA